MAKRRPAYISFAWSNNLCETLERADRYRRIVFLAGMQPVCPVHTYAGIVDLENPEELKAFSEICRSEAQRCPVLVVCGDDTNDTVMEEIAIARRTGNTVTSLNGLRVGG